MKDASLLKRFAKKWASIQAIIYIKIRGLLASFELWAKLDLDNLDSSYIINKTYLSPNEWASYAL